MAVHEVRCAVDRVHQPTHPGRSVHPGSLLAQDRVVGTRGQDVFHDAFLGPAVDVGDQVGEGRLRVRDLDGPSPAAQFWGDDPGSGQGQVSEGGGFGHGGWRTSVDRMVVPGSLLELAGSPLGHGPKRQDGDDSDTAGRQDRSQDPHRIRPERCNRRHTAGW